MKFNLATLSGASALTLLPSEPVDVQPAALQLAASSVQSSPTVKSGQNARVITITVSVSSNRSNMFPKAILLIAVIVRLGESLSVPAQVDERFLENPRYHSYDELTNLFRKLEAENPTLAKLRTVGRSVKNRELWALEINANVGNRSLLTPMFKYVANMHGDESVGRQLMIYLAEYLIYNYGKDERVTRLVNSTDIYLMPSMNPDGYENSQEGLCDSKPKYVGRENENHIDLNRDFPDQFDPVRAGTILSGRQPETVALMTWIISRPFVLSGNLHGGAVVASYPFDDSNTKRTCCKESKSPDNEVFKELALTYATSHPVMSGGKACKDNFNQGITNGAFWYEVKGGMQDFNYVHSNCFEVTFELSCCKFPPADSLPQEWQNNKESLLRFMEATHWGAKGLVTDAKGEAVLDADVVVVGVNHNVTTSNRGEYWRLLLPGEYEMYASAYGFQPSDVVKVTVEPGSTIIQNFILHRLAPEKDEYKRLVNETKDFFDEYGFVVHEESVFKHHHYEEMVEFLMDFNRSYPHITYLHSIGKSVQGRDLYVMVLGSTPDRHVPGKPEFKYVANMHGNEVVGRELLLLFIKYLCERYKTDDRVTRILNTTRIHLLPSMNPDGYEMAQEGDPNSVVGRGNANNVDLNRNFPDQYGINQFNRVTQPETKAVMDWTLSEPFILSANLHNGGLVANYPFDDNPTNENGVENLTPDDAIFKYLAHTYANAHKSMFKGQPCPMFPKEHFTDGITNGAKWYIVTGGMQDWNYLVAGCMELTLEIGCYKYPHAQDLPKYWQDNKEALLTYMEQVHKGAYGIVRSTIGQPIAGAKIVVEGVSHFVKSATDGDYFRILLPGMYNLTVKADGYESYTSEITIPANGSLEYHVNLMKNDPLHWASAYDFGIGENQYKPKYHSNEEIYSLMAKLENRYPGRAGLQSGDDYVSMAIHWLKVTDQIDQSDETKFHVAVMGNLYATQPIGRELIVYLARHLLEGYHVGDPKIRMIMNNTVLHLIPVVDKAFEQIWGDYPKEALGNKKPEGLVCNNISADFKQVGDQIVGTGRANNGELKSVANAFKHMLLEEKFDLVLNIEGGNTDLIYPKLRNAIDIYQFFAEAYLKSVKAEGYCPWIAKGTDDVLTDYLYHEYNTPVLTAKVSCCQYPAVDNIPYVWRDSLDPIMEVLGFTTTGVQGFVQNTSKHPLRNSTVKVRGLDRVREVTKSLALFKIMLPPGMYTLEVSCHQYDNAVIDVIVKEGALKSIPVILKASQSRLVVTDEEMHEPLVQNGVVTSGIRGYVKDNLDHPIPDADIFVLEKNETLQSDANGKYSVVLAPGKYTLKVSASGYSPNVKYFSLDGTEGNPKIVMFTLVKKTTVWGMPRLVFVVFMGVLCFGAVGVGLCCYMACRKTNDYGLLSQNGFFEDFKDLDESKENELFTRPLTGKPLTKPYFDDDDDDDENNAFSDVEASSEEEDEVILLQTRK